MMTPLMKIQRTFARQVLNKYQLVISETLENKYILAPHIATRRLSIPQYLQQSARRYKEHLRDKDLNN